MKYPQTRCKRKTKKINTHHFTVSLWGGGRRNDTSLVFSSSTEVLVLKTYTASKPSPSWPQSKMDLWKRKKEQETERRVYCLGKRNWLQKQQHSERNAWLKKKTQILPRGLIIIGIMSSGLHLQGSFRSTEVHGAVLINECSSMGEDTVHVHLNSRAGQAGHAFTGPDLLRSHT